MTELTPKSLVLTLLGVAHRPVASRELVAVGALFGFEDNAMRVAITRLARAQHIENRGAVYVLTGRAAQLGRFADSWRQGDARMRPWDHDWLCVLHPTGLARTPRRKSTRALQHLGFRTERFSLWVRPNNLCKPRTEIVAALHELGLTEGAEAFVGTDFDVSTSRAWQEGLWDVDAVQRGLVSSLREIERSRRVLEGRSDLRALVESFVIGDRAVRRLVVDPLLPDEICDGGPRRALTDALIEYDRMGKALWESTSLDKLIASATRSQARTLEGPA